MIEIDERALLEIHYVFRSDKFTCVLFNNADILSSLTADDVPYADADEMNTTVARCF